MTSSVQGNTYQLVISANSMHTYASYRYGSVNVLRYSGDVNIGHAFPAIGTVTQQLTFDQIASIHESIGTYVRK